jgi:hypothetical protein
LHILALDFGVNSHRDLYPFGAESNKLSFFIKPLKPQDNLQEKKLVKMHFFLCKFEKTAIIRIAHVSLATLGFTRQVIQRRKLFWTGADLNWEIPTLEI